MNHKITTLILSFAILSSASLALAEYGIKTDASVRASSTSIKVRAEAKAEMQEKRQENVEQRKASSTARRVEMQQGLAKKKAEHTARVLTATVERLEKIIARVESRIAKVKAEGKDVTQSEAFVLEAKNYLGLAKMSIAPFASVDLSSDKAQENFERVRQIAFEAKEHIRAAHQSLMKAIRSLGKTRAEVNAASSLIKS